MNLYPDVSAKLHQILEQAEALTTGERGDMVRQGMKVSFNLRVSTLLLDLDRKWKDIVQKEVLPEHNGAFMDEMQPEWQALQALVKAAHPAAVRKLHEKQNSAVTQEEQNAAVRREGHLLSGIGPSLKEGELKLIVDNDKDKS